MLEPAGETARRVEGLWWLLLWISVAVFLVVAGLMAVAIVRHRHRGLEIDATRPRWGEPFVVLAGVVIPIVVLASVFVVSVRVMQAIASDDSELTVQVIGHDWWWEVRYPNGAVTANEIHIPLGQPVRFEVETADVIHSFWVPELGPKIDMIPGRTNAIVLDADRPGTYRGQCAEFCGLQHANMAFFVVAEPQQAFDAWVADQAASAAPIPTGPAEAGLQVFLGSTCDGCHAIRGTQATAELAPDLTHFASRETIAAGTLANTRENLARWILAPQSVKPGTIMPPTQLSEEELEALLDFLAGLT